MARQHTKGVTFLVTKMRPKGEAPTIQHTTLPLVQYAKVIPTLSIDRGSRGSSGVHGDIGQGEGSYH